MYQIEVKRSSPDKEKIFRRYREFDELQNKLMQCFPDAQLPQLPGKILIPGKSHTKQVSKQAECFSERQDFITSLWQWSILANIICNFKMFTQSHKLCMSSYSIFLYMDLNPLCIYFISSISGTPHKWQIDHPAVFYVINKKDL